MLPFLLAAGTAVMTFCGGLVALRMRDRLHLILGYAAGAVIGVAFFDLMPEAFELGAKTHTTAVIGTIIGIGFVLYLLIDRSISLHSHEAEEGHDHSHTKGNLGAGSLSTHSLLDGLGIGLALKVSPSLGAIVAIAVLAHDFSDGINTVTMITRHGGDRRSALKWLTVDALTPTLGVAIAHFINVDESSLGIILALFAGFFLYIGASDLIPESHHNHPVKATTMMTILGALTVFIAVHFAG